MNSKCMQEVPYSKFEKIIDSTLPFYIVKLNISFNCKTNEKILKYEPILLVKMELKAHICHLKIYFFFNFS